MKLKILSIDFLLANEQIHKSSFYPSISFVDYDVLIVDPVYIEQAWGKHNKNLTRYSDGSVFSFSNGDSGFGKKMKRIMRQRSQEVQLLLKKTEGIVVCILRNKRNVLKCALDANEYARTNFCEEIHAYSWLPIQQFVEAVHIETNPFLTHGETKKHIVERKYTFSASSFNPEERIGLEIGEVDCKHSFAQYFLVLKDKIHYEAVINDPILIKNVKPIAKNKVGEIIACEIPFGNGKFIFIPPTDSSNTPEVTGVILDCVLKSMQWEKPLNTPAWIQQYALPGEDELQNEISDIENKEKIVMQEKKVSESKRNEFELLKGLLYETGKHRLEPAVRKAFQLIGFNVLDPSTYNEDYDLLILEDIMLIGEIEGGKGKIDVEKFRQLHDYVTTATLKGKNCKGILIGNGHIGQEPSTRPEQFTDAAINGCNKFNYCRITTMELYNIVCKLLVTPTDQLLKDSIKKNILQSSGEIKSTNLL